MHAVLESAWVYRLFRGLTGSENLNQVFAEEYVQSHPEADILDVGCGPADIVRHLRFRSYLGIDNNGDYIRAASRRYPHAQFVQKSVTELQPEDKKFDRIIAVGLLHHLSDEEVTGLLDTISRLLKPEGLFVSMDPCFRPGQPKIARCLHALDRGQYVRGDSELIRLVNRSFSTVQSDLREDLCRIPSSALMLRAR